ncbi:MAG TPA: HAD-IIIA family hydrolase [Bacteroidales bacterium]|nr:HAD-IIIA family hydrolase [Bacteroidales bacterium]HSA44194.1 HAD-IIIA family hydrolase [Bacteroidales bacterium]
MSNYKELLRHITTFVFDYDGVLTGGTVLINTDGELLRTANVKDGYALKFARELGYNIAIISGGKSESVRLRFKPLGINDVFLHASDKLSIFNQYLSDNQISPEQVLFMGDDIPDFPLMERAGVGCCPADAAEEIKKAARYISHLQGGDGCARDVIEQVLKIQGKWFNSSQAFIW